VLGSVKVKCNLRMVKGGEEIFGKRVGRHLETWGEHDRHRSEKESKRVSGWGKWQVL